MSPSFGTPPTPATDHLGDYSAGLFDGFPWTKPAAMPLGGDAGSTTIRDEPDASNTSPFHFKRDLHNLTAGAS
jgi:hypothetical protein